MDLSGDIGKPRAIKQLKDCDKIDGEKLPLIGLPSVRLIYHIEEYDAVIDHVWFCELPAPNNTRDIP